MHKRYMPKIRATGVAMAASFTASAAFARPPEAGTIIDSFGTVSYLSPRLGIREAVTSNIVETEVSSVQSFTVTSDQSILRAPGDNALLYYEVENTGNTDIEVGLTFGDLQGDFDLGRTVVWIDVNNNGRVDGDDERVQPDASYPLEVEGRISILVDALVPDTAVAGQSVTGNFSGVSLGTGVTRSARGVIGVMENTMSLVKSADVTEAVAGGEIVYTLNLRNNSDQAIDPDTFGEEGTFVIDGVATELLIVRDEIPRNTDFQRIIDAVNFDPVFHRRGDLETEWTRTMPADNTSIDMIGFASEDPLEAGHSRDFQFSVSIGPNTDGFIVQNTAEVLSPGANGGAPLLSNTVSTPITGEAGVVNFYADDRFDTALERAPFDELVFLQVESGFCNATSGIDEAVITITSFPERDSEQVIAVETSENSGVFRTVGLPTALAPPVLVGDGVLQGSRRGTAEASVDCDPAARDEIDLAPAGAVFLSATNEPVPNARVELLDAAGNVIDEAVTDAAGLYDITPLANGAHSLRVTPPEGLVAPSARRGFAGFGRNVLAGASFAETFIVDASEGGLDVDVPVDPDLTGALTLSIQADRNRVTIGETIKYTIEVRNNAPIAIDASEIINTLPRGFGFIEGSGMYNGVSLADPFFRGDRELVFEVGLLEPNSTNMLMFFANVLSTAGEGDKLDTAIAQGNLVGFGELIQSNRAGVTVTVDNSDGVFSRDGVVLGKVFLDCDADGFQGHDEPGIPGVQIHTQEGLSVLTDANGRYTFGGLSPRTHVLNVYESTLPEGAAVSASRVLDAGVGGSRFVPVRAGEIRSEEFAVTGCNDDIFDEVRKRLTAFQSRLGVGVNTQGLQFDAQQSQISVKSSQALSAPVTERDDGERDDDEPVTGDDLQGVIPITRIAATEDLDAVLKGYEQPFGFVDLVDGDLLIQKTISVRVVGPAGGEISLLHNGEAVSATRIGQKRETEAGQIIEYVALDLLSGENRLDLIVRDGFGNVRGEETVLVTAPGEPARVQIVAPEVAIADPAQPVQVYLQIVDADGHPTAAPIEASLSAQEDQFDVRDTSEQVPGVQTLLTEPTTPIDLIPSQTVGTRTISVETQFGRAEARIRFTPNIQGPGIAVGFGEASFGFNGGSVGTLTDVFSRDEISPFEETEEGVEGAFFLKGRLFDKTLLTLRHDSALNTDDGLFRSVEPDEFYPVYGDQSERGFDARSRGKTFAKLERGSSYVVFGDVAFDASASALQLGAFQRTLEGAKAHLEAGRLTADAYVGQTDTGQIVLEIPAQGISGPYDLGFGEVIENSETVELLTRDRNQPGVILSTERLGRFSAYTVDYFAQTLVFNRPIPSRDVDLNPVSIRVTFETPQGEGDDYWLFGGEVELALTDRLSTGFRQLTSDGPEGSEDDRTVRAAYVAAQLGERGRVEVEAAQSIDPQDETGTAIRLNYEQQFKRGSIGARLATTTADFDAPGASVSSGREEARLFGNVKAGPGTLSAEALYTADTTSEAQRYGLVARYEANLTGNLRARAGGRYVDDRSSTGAREDALTLIAGLGWSPKFLKGANVDLEVEQEVTDGTQSRVSVGGDYALSPKLRLYAQADYTGSRSGSFGLLDGFNDDVTLRLGGEYRVTDRVTAFSEFRANESLFDSGVANGLTASWSVSPSLNLRVRGEHVQPISTDFLRNTAIAVGATWEPETSRYIIDGDVEFAAGQGGQRTWFVSNTAGYRLDDFTFVGRNRYARSENVGTDVVRQRDRARIGAAWRPTKNDTLNALGWYEYELDEQELLEERRHIWSFGGELKPAQKIRFRGRWAGQVFNSETAQISQSSTTMLVQGGIDWDAFKKLNLAVNASIIGDQGFSNDRTFGVGGEANYHLAKNLLVGVGYNYSGITEERLDRLFRSGFFVRMRLKFDENIWNIFDRFP